MQCGVLTLRCVLCQGGPRISEAERRKQRELVAKEIEKLQSGIQALCRSTTPLGKIVDYVQVSVWVYKHTYTLGRTGCVSSRLTFCLYHRRTCYTNNSPNLVVSGFLFVDCM